MRIWNDGLYGNEDAQSFLSEMAFLYESLFSELEEEVEEEQLIYYLEQLMMHPDAKYPECQLVLIAFERDLLGEVSENKAALALIEEQQEATALACWLNSEHRFKILEELKNRVDCYEDQGLNSNLVDVWEWIQEKQAI